MCGDTTHYPYIETLLDCTAPSLVLTDSPYGIRIVNRKTGKLSTGGRKYPEVIGDTNGDMFKEHYHLVRRECNNLIIWGVRTSRTFYFHHAGGFSGTSRRTQKRCLSEMVSWRGQIVRRVSVSTCRNGTAQPARTPSLMATYTPPKSPSRLI